MKLIGIVARAYYNKDNQKIIQLNEAIRLALAKYDEYNYNNIEGCQISENKNVIDINENMIEVESRWSRNRHGDCVINAFGQNDIKYYHNFA